ncbi:AAA domain-containing protein [Streptomyces sp. P9(2023)]|uniref:AAA domain-containing protein n=1 Tax=Streptomyces sp. P9(2023) TaxID=3064394 RepID=UPI0028F44E34|nr:AAA domain-containing protein [Streptomyces sp. P9(2023)]MDT9693410.1 AAA domain-containing protein [Streptomyces sp. P9(2023)]
MHDDLGPEEIRDVLEKLFTGERAVHAPEGDVPYKIVGDVEEVIKGRLVRFVLSHPGLQRDREVSLFLQIDGVVGELWEHEVRNLLRLRMLGHPALPVIEDGRFDQTHKVAFIMTRQVGRPLPEEGWSDVREWATTFPVVAFEQFSLLVDALSQLHGTRIVHRNLTLAAIRMTQVPGKATQATLSLARFELSALLNNLLHVVNGPQDREKYEEAMRALFHTPPAGISPAQHLAYIAPETYPSVFGDVRSRRLDHGSTDVFGLGVLGWELFLDSLTDRLPEECAAVDRAGPDELPDALVRLHSAMRRELNIDTRLPRPLRTALLEMLDPSPSGRSSSFEAAAALERHRSAITLALEPAAETEGQKPRPRLVAFMPEQSVGTIHETRGWTDHRTDTPEGCQELKEFLADELKQAQLVHCPGGAEGYARDGDRRSLAEAEWVLIGAQAVWFCAYLYEESVMRRRVATHKDTLVIKYLADKRYAGDLLSASPRRRIGDFDLVPFYLGKSLADERRDRPSWLELTDSVTTERVLQDAGIQKMLRSFSFMLEYRAIELKGRSYPYKLVDDNSGRIILTQDKDRDRRWLHGDPLLTAYAATGRRHRPPLGDFADQILAEDEFAQLVVVEDRNSGNGSGNFAGPYYGGHSVKVRIKERLDSDSFVVEAPAGHRDLPEIGWLRPYDDRGTEIQLQREARGYDSLAHKPGLARTLSAPRSIALRGGRAPEPVTGPAKKQKKLRGRADAIIADMLKLHPFYALQGPPGTGKSTLVARALRKYLGGEYGARVLVSAQSNDALDQLAGKIIEELAPKIEDRSILVLRELSKGRDRHDLPPALRRLTAEPLAEDLVRHIEQRVEEGWEGARAGEEDLMRRWSRLARANMVELTERIKSGADIVLATCSIAGTLTDEIRDPSDMFDWVIIEEAAKAWPTEIIIPLALGVRWTLIGDYLQLGPHRAQDVASFLDGLASNQHERVRLHYEQRESYLEFVQLFRRFFDGHLPGLAAEGKHPVDVLDMQFRMHRDISLPFATAFYPAVEADASEPVDTSVDPESRTFLKTDEEILQIHRRTKPEYLEDAPLVWLDTSRSDDCGDVGYWWNPGEIDLIEDLVRKMGLADRKDPSELTVLTPYRRQVKELSRGFLEGRVHTVHSFQGGEAKTVVLSLVRSSDRGPDFRQNVGHTAQPDVVNVMLSRARSLLVVVGNMAHFERHGGADWQTVIQVFREVGRIVDASTGEIAGGGSTVSGIPAQASGAPDASPTIPAQASATPDADADGAADSTVDSATTGLAP